MNQELVVFGKSRAEMVTGQMEMVEWTQAQILRAEAKHQEAVNSLTFAEAEGWKLDGWKDAERKARKRIDYYKKIVAALQAGYVIIPDFPIDVFAIRTKRAYPIANYRESSQSWDSQDRTQRGQSLAIGEGDYFDSQPFVAHSTRKTDEGKELTKFWASSFDDVDFPMRAVKPVILEETSKALALKIFDEVGIIPGRPGSVRRLNTTRGADPMIIGRILFPSGGGLKVVAFLITWWLKPSDIEV